MTYSFITMYNYNARLLVFRLFSVYSYSDITNNPRCIIYTKSFYAILRFFQELGNYYYYSVYTDPFTSCI